MALKSAIGSSQVPAIKGAGVGIFIALAAVTGVAIGLGAGESTFSVKVTTGDFEGNLSEDEPVETLLGVRENQYGVVAFCHAKVQRGIQDVIGNKVLAGSRNSNAMGHDRSPWAKGR